MNNTLIIGTGGCGNKLLSTLIGLISQRVGLKCSYDYLFANSNKREMEVLDYCNVGSNSLIISGDGTGKSRTKAKKSIGADKVNVMNRLDGIADKYSSAYVLLSGDGGFGNGSLETFSKVLKQLNPNIAINTLVAMPRTKSKRIGLENALSLYEDIKRLQREGFINSYQFIDNDKMQDEEEFNLRTMSLFLDSLEMGVEALDGNDSLIVNSAPGYKIILPIRSGFNTIKEAVDDAIKKSPFVIPSKNKCTHIYGIYDSESYLHDDIFEEYTVTDFDKVVASDDTLMVMSGMGRPDAYMNVLNTAYEELTNNNDVEDEEEFTFKKKTETSTNKNNSIKENKTSNVNRKQRLRAMMDDSFWD